MKMKQLALCVTAGLVGGVGFAQETTATRVVAANTTAAMDQATTGTPAQSGDDAASTSMSALMAKNFSEEHLQVRWKAEEQLYKDAGIPEEKIQKLHDLNVATWRAMGAGEKTDYQSFIRERNAVLTPEEMQKLRTTQREAIAKRTRIKDEATTAPSM